MNDISFLALASVTLIGVLMLIPSAVLPVILSYAGSYRSASFWLRKHFYTDMGFYSPLDLAYLYIITDRLDEVMVVYRKYLRKGNIASEYFVSAWTAAHQGRWKDARESLVTLRKHTIMNEIDLKKLAAAIDAKDVAAIDAIYLIDMNGRAFIRPSLLRTLVVTLAGVAFIAAAIGLFIEALTRVIG